MEYTGVTDRRWRKGTDQTDQRIEEEANYKFASHLNVFSLTDK